MKLEIINNEKIKILSASNFHLIFNKKNGFTACWGKTADDDPQFCQWGPIIIDCEISTICHKACPWCYKSNTAMGKNMSLETFKELFAKFPKTLTQIAMGVGDIDANEDLWDIMNFCRNNDVIPNITINGEKMTPEFYNNLANTCGAVAISLYDRNTCYNAVKELTDRRLTQVNIHALLSSETFDKCMQAISDIRTDTRLQKLNAIVFLLLKPHGLRNEYHSVSKEQFRELVAYAMEKEIGYGFDSCSAPAFLDIVKGNKQLETVIEKCESACFSYYLNVDGIGSPCSFNEGNYSIDVLHAENFMKDVWFGEETKKFREKLLANCRNCPTYKLGA